MPHLLPPTQIGTGASEHLQLALSQDDQALMGLAFSSLFPSQEKCVLYKIESCYIENGLKCLTVCNSY